MARSLSSNTHPKLLLSGLLLGGLMGLTACQPSSDAQDEANNQATEASNSAETSQSAGLSNDPNNTQSVEIIDQQTPETEAELNETDSVQPSELEEATQTESSTNTVEASPSKGVPPASEIQVTDVEYQDSKGRSIHVTFQTSATATLQADLRLPSGKRVLLTAPTGQGNNPTYRSTDGSIELVTHGGGSSIDLFYENQRAKFDAVNTESEILKPQ
ncbi:hypothetical protein [Psychrobacter sp. UBA3962]|uniref:hypothetical protein n=1 Tax=Psychrobacter sp. UBA3962 TaxID=1947352 RepID=UPI0025CF2BCA|nr:hypothetical protein [Psychrobacter sp. UBA3962]